MTAASTAADFFRTGWAAFPHDPTLAAWVATALPVARAAIAAPENAKWFRYGGTWFAGVNASPNDARGAMPGGPPLGGVAVDFIRSVLSLSAFDWDRAQISVCYPGYPQPMEGESEATFQYRVKRDAAHVDGVQRVGPERRRFAREYHGFLLGVPLAPVEPGSSPFVVWEGSHEIVRAALGAALNPYPPETWGEIDVTDAYHAARRRCFDICPRVEVSVEPGASYLVHRLALHGMAPWRASSANAEGRIVAYFRPDCLAPDDWLARP
ncbi:MAG: hypothetical protein U1E46_14295 [Hyphomicrobiales bacterium]